MSKDEYDNIIDFPGKNQYEEADEAKEAEEDWEDIEDADPDGAYSDTADEAQEADSEEEKEFPHFWQIDLPTALSRLVVKQYVAAGAFVVATVVLFVILKDIRALFGLFISGMLVYKGISVTLDYAGDKVQEIPVLCASVNPLAMRKQIKVIFRTADEVPTYYEFIVPGKRTDITPNFSYVIYFSPKEPRVLMGYQQL